MIPKIISVKIGYSNSILLLNGTNSVLIDTGIKGHLQQFKALFKRNNLNPTDIKLIVLTHTHNDHTGNLIELAKLTGAKVLVHKNEFESLKTGFTPIPSGTHWYTKAFVFLGRKLKPNHASPEPFIADVTNITNLSLSDYGISGEVIHTPGHTAGSQSVLIGKTLIAGDTFFNIREKIIFPPVANNPQQVLKTWKYLFNMGIEEIIPAHGKKFRVEKAIAEYEKWNKKLKT